MIVKDEAHIITDTLTKLISKIKFDYYIISDTGSKDNTKFLIKNFFDDIGISGKIYDDTWKDFGYNRSLALKHAFGKSDYTFIFDADDYIEGNLDLNNLTLDSYMLKFGNSSSAYERMCLVKSNIVWKYIGVLHEYITSDQQNLSKGSILGDYFIVSGRTSSRNKDPEKYLKDALILEKGYYSSLENNDNLHNRYVYYCANSYSDAGDRDNSIKWYKLTLKANGWFDERYNSCLKLFELTGNKDYLVESYHHNPRRVEGIYNLIKHYCCENQHSIAMGYYNFIKNYFENEIDDLSTKLFARTLDYTFYLPYYMIIVSEKTKNFDIGIKMYNIIFENMKDTLLAGKWWIDNLIFNFQFFNSSITLIKKFKKFKIFLTLNGIIKSENKSEIKEIKKIDGILFYTGFAEFLWNISYSENNALGGSERAVINIAKELSKNYTIFIVGDVLEETIGNIKFIHRFNFNKKIHFKYIIISRYISFFTIFPNITADRLILMAHDTHFMNNLSGCNKSPEEIIENSIDKIDCCVCLTQWHANEYSMLYPKLKYVIINNGISPELFLPGSKIESSFIYTSGSIRGLRRLLDLWPGILQILPNAVLNIASYEPFPNNDLDNLLQIQINNLKNVYHHGKLNQIKLYLLMQSSEYWLYPCSFRETSCITAMEMMMSEVICLYYPIAGLTDTMNGHGIQICEGNEIETLNGIINKKELIESAKKYAMECSWVNRAKEWNLLLNGNIKINGKSNIKIINLEKRQDRKIEMENNLKKFGITFDFIKGVDGLTLGSSKEIQELFKGNDHSYHKGVIGCALSHINLWKQLVNDPDNDYYIILEDDLIFALDFKEKLDCAIKLFNLYKISFLSIGSFDIPVENKLIENLSVIKQENIIWTGGAHGYIILKSACQQILNNNFSYTRAIDFEIVKKKSFDIYFLNEYIVKQKSFEDTDIQRHSECFHFANELPKKLVFYHSPGFNIKLLDDYFNSLKMKYNVVVTSDLNGIKYIDEIIFVHELHDKSVFNLNCDISYLNTEPLNLISRLNHVIYNVYYKYPIKTFYDYSLANISIMNEHKILNTAHLEYQWNNEIEFLKECSKVPKIYDFGIMCSGFVPTNDVNELTPPRRRELVKHLLQQGFTINIISGWGKSRDIELGKCKTILNIHGQNGEDPSTIFEHIRCNRLLYAGYPVFSEESYRLDKTFIDNHRTLKLIPFESFFKLTKRSKVIDCFIFYNEIEMLEYRLNVLKDTVDHFVIVEATTTFTGKSKKMYFDPGKYSSFNITHVIVNDLPFNNSENGNQWKNEEHQRNCIERGLSQIKLDPDDFIIISDVDEIPDPVTLNLIKLESNLEVLSQFEQDFYYYNLSNKLPDLWYSCKIFKYKLFVKTIQELRLEVFYGIYPGGWHLSYFGSPDFISNKIQNFGHQEFNTPVFTNPKLISQRIENYVDIFDRPIRLDYIPVYKNNYLPPTPLKSFIPSKNYCFIHSCNATGDTYRLQHLLNILSKINLEKVFINNIGIQLNDNIGIQLNDNIGLHLNLIEGIEVIQYSEDTSLFEVPTINMLRSFSKKNPGCNILYLHTKGSGHPKDAQNINDWIDMMLYFLVDQSTTALHLLENCDTVGCNYHNKSSCRAPPHFSGNFWWAKTDYLSGLPDCGPNKFDAEFWLHRGNPKFKSLHDTGGMNHYFNEYPCENYRFHTS